MPNDYEISISLSDPQVWAFAQLLKRIGFSEVRANAKDEDEARLMIDAILVVQKALAERGVDPR